MKKPGYTLTRQAFWWSFALAWGVIIGIVVSGLRGVGEAVQLAPIVVPSMIALIATLLGIHRFTGAMDFQAAAQMASVAPPYDPRANPTAAMGDVR
jgi:hypothetical protein